MMPAIVAPILKRALEACIASPMCEEKKVQKTMPRDSPQETMQKQFRVAMANMNAERWKLIAKAARMPKISEESRLKGSSRMV